MYGSIPIGSALAGVAGATIGTRWGVMIGAAGLALSMVPMLTKSVRRLRDPESAGVPEVASVADGAEAGVAEGMRRSPSN